MVSRTDAYYLLASIVVVALPCLPMADLHSVFAVDWPNQVWLMNYVGSYFAEHHQFPSVIHSDRLIGMPYPVFYGYLFFPLFGALSLAWNADLTIRVAACTVFALQFFLLFRLGSRVTSNRFGAFCIATLVTWAIYPLTNLYNRGAIPEFFATNLLICSSAIWFFLLEEYNRTKRFLLCNLFVFSFVLAAGSHPITALYGACFMSMLVVATLLIKRPNLRSLLPSLLVPLVLGAISLAPWVMATVRFTPQMALAASFKHVGYYYHSLDSLYGRLMPIPLETKSYKHKLADDHAVTPHLDAQINIPLLLLFVFCFVSAFRKGGLRNRAALGSVIALAVIASILVWLSISRGALDKLGHNFRTIQFAYRLVTYINFSVLIAVLLCFWQQAVKPKIIQNRFALVGLLLLSFAGLAIKLHHVQSAMVSVPSVAVARTKEFSNSLLKMPDSFYGSDAYTIVNLFPELNPSQVETIRNCPFQPSSTTFGAVEPVATPTGFTQTNIQQFPWNYVYQEKIQLERMEHDHRIALNMPSSQSVQYEFIPDSLWATLRLISLSVFFLWSIATFVSCTISKSSLFSLTSEWF